MFEQQEVNLIADHKPEYPPLDRTAFLIERACLPNYAPPYCAEEAHLFAMLAKAMSQNAPPSEDSGPG